MTRKRRLTGPELSALTAGATKADELVVDALEEIEHRLDLAKPSAPSTPAETVELLRELLVLGGGYPGEAFADRISREAL